MQKSAAPVETRTCSACARPARARGRFCERCAKRRQRAKAKGQPLAEPTATFAEVVNVASFATMNEATFTAWLRDYRKIILQRWDKTTENGAYTESVSTANDAVHVEVQQCERGRTTTVKAL